QKGTWDLAPGFEHGKNSRFDRKIETECITCHNAYPDPVAGSMNKYRTVPLGIDCERCHGPGSIHVAAKLKGDRVDTSREKDYTIVNPANLSTSEQNNLCQRCHLQGIAVLNPGKTFFDFQPSDQLKSVMNVFMPAYSGEDKHMIMASHVERMKMSACYLRSEKLSCVTCHNPHISVRSTPRTQFNQSCQSCHKASASCTGSKETRNKNGDDCVQCHMPKNGSIDIPHVAVTDHFIRRNPEASEMKSVVQFIGLRCYNNDHPDARTRARAWMEYFERYDSRPVFLDSCLLELKKTGMPEEDAKDDDVVRYYFLREDFTRLTTMAKTCDASSLKNAWTAYRYGEACVKTRQPAAAIPFLQRACSLMPLVPEYQLKLANAWLDVNNLKEAYRILEPMKTEYPRNADVWFTLGYIAMQNKESGQAIYYNQQCLLLHPDKEQALINLAVLYHQRNQTHLIRPLLYRVLKRNPGHVQVKAMLKELDQ
ncbi:MAG TPA: multiheme c-type cytochrome, partial [Chitinophagaceae bacterium]|nr:multiheme c-type cytochrome [Chitinophagaceae bacterium]